MLDHKTLIAFYRACGYGGVESINRTNRYLNLQEKAKWAQDALAEMTDEDELKLEEMNNE